MNKRKLTASVMSVAAGVLFGALAWSGLTIAGAAEGKAATGSSGSNALSALGIDSTQAPEGYVENDRSNPYGKDTVTMMPVGEFVTIGNPTISSDKINGYNVKGNKDSESWTDNSKLTSTIYGQGVADITNSSSDEERDSITEDIWSKTSTGTTSSSRTVGTSYDVSPMVEIKKGDKRGLKGISSYKGEYVLTRTAAGNFDGNTEGKDAQIAMVYTKALSKNGGLYLRVADATGDFSKSDEIELLSQKEIIGNPGATISGEEAGAVPVEDFASSPYLLQNYLQVTTGDFNNDGKDEIAVYVPQQGQSRVEVYRLKTDASKDTYTKSSKWELAWTYSFKEYDYVSNMVSLTSGDLNQDGYDDLAATWGYYYGPEDNQSSTAAVLFGAEGNNMLRNNTQQFDLDYNGDRIIRGAFTYGDMTGSGTNCLILGGQLEGDIKNGNLNKRIVSCYSWDGSQFTQTLTQVADLFEKDDKGNYVNDILVHNNGEHVVNGVETIYSTPLMVTNLAVIEQGANTNAQIYVDSYLLEYGEEGLKIAGTADATSMQPNQGAPVSYVEYGGVSTDIVGLGKQSFVTMQQTLSENGVKQGNGNDGQKVERKITYTVRQKYYKNWIRKALRIPSYRTVTETKTVTEPVDIDYELSDFKAGHAYQVAFNVGSSVKRQKVDYSQSVCVANTDNDTTYMTYKGNTFGYSDPRILAVLASPPVFGDLLDRDDLSGNYGESTTSYAESTGSSTEESTSSSITAGIYVSYSHTFEVLKVPVATVEWEQEVIGNMTWGYAEESALEQTVTYSTTAGQDTVVFYSIPMEMYNYEIHVPDKNGNYDVQTSTVNVPHEAAVRKLTLDEYEAIAADYPTLPQVSGTVLTSDPYDPSTYPSSDKGYDVICKYEGDAESVGYSGAGGGAATSEEIVMSKSKNNSFETESTIDFKAGAGPGEMAIGVVAGTGDTTGTVTTSTSGSTYAAEMQAMPAEAQDYGYAYNWRLFAYRGKSLNSGTYSEFPVVSYIVSDLSCPPSLPEDFEQDSSATTASKNTLTWSYDKAIAGFQLYRYYDFPDGSGSYELAFVPMSDGVYDRQTGTYTFTYTDEGLSPYTDYNYQIQAVRSVLPTSSIPSEAMQARTKSDRGYPQIELSGEFNADTGNLKIYPDSNSTVKATVKNEQDYTVNGKVNLAYQWQVNRGSGWEDLKGKTTNELTFVNAGSADQATYRLRVNAIYFDSTAGSEFQITEYSNTFSTVYSKRDAMVAISGRNDRLFTATASREDGKNVLTVDMTLKSSHTGNSTPPTGKVLFTVRGTDYTGQARVDLTNPGAGGNGNATAKFEGIPDGVYEVTASYDGDRNFKGLEVDEPVVAVAGSARGYLLNLTSGSSKQTQFTYGDRIGIDFQSVTALTQPTTASRENVSLELYDGGTNKDGTPSFTTLDQYATSFDTPAVGNYELVVKKDGVEVASRSFSVLRRAITIKANSGEGSKGHISMPGWTVTSEQGLVLGDKLENLGLVNTAFNSANNEVTDFENALPGNYTIVPSASDVSKLSNYNVTWVNGLYTIEAQKYEATYEVVPDEEGNTHGQVNLSNEGDVFSAGSTLTFYATPDASYEVDTWRAYPVNEDGTLDENYQGFTPQTGGNTFHVTMMNQKVHVKVSFKKRDNMLTVSAGKGGSVELPAGFTSPAYPNAGAQYTFKAVPDEGYHFVNWQYYVDGGDNISSKGTVADDGTSTYDVTAVASNTTLTAYFERDSYVLTLGDNLEGVYLYDHDGSEVTAKVEKVVESGAEIAGDTEVTVRPKPGFVIAEGAEWTCPEGATKAEDGQSVKFSMTDNVMVSAQTAQKSLTVTTEAENGSIMLSGVTEDGTVEGGSRVEAQAKADYGFAFSRWLVNDKEVAPDEDGKLVIDAIDADSAIKAEFIKRFAYTVTTGTQGNGTLAYTLKSADGDLIEEKKALDNGAVIDVYAGDTLTFTATPSSSIYMVSKWYVDGATDDTVSDTYELASIATNRKITAVFASKGNYKVAYKSDITATQNDFPFKSGTLVGGGAEMKFAAPVPDGQMIDHWRVRKSEKGDYVDITAQNAAEWGITSHPYDPTLVVGSLTSNLDVSYGTTPYKGVALPSVPTGANYEVSNVTKTPSQADADEVRMNGDVTFTLTPKVADDATFVKATVNGYDLDAQTGGVANCDAVEATKAEDGSYTVTIKGMTAAADIKVYELSVSKGLDSYTVSDELKGALVAAEKIAADADDAAVKEAIEDILTEAAQKSLSSLAGTSEAYFATIHYVDASGQAQYEAVSGDTKTTVAYAELAEGLNKADSFVAYALVESGEKAGTAEKLASPERGDTSVSFTLKGGAPALVAWAKYVPPTPGGGGGIIEDPNTEVVTNPDGSVTTTVTNPDDGSKAISTEKADGTTTSQNVAADGTITDASATVSAEAAASGDVVELPLVGITVAEDKGTAPAVSIAAPVKARISVPVSGVIPEGAVVMVLKDDGSYEPLPKSVVEDGKVVAQLEGNATIKVVDNSVDFPDVADDAWYAGVADFASAHGLVNGVILPDGGVEFRGDLSMSRAMIAAVLNNLESKPKAEGVVDFDDVPAGEWYADVVSWAAEKGIIKGYGDGDNFGPNDDITREQMVTMMMRYAEMLGMDTSARADLSGYSDAGQLTFGSDAMAWAVEAGLIKGYANTNELGGTNGLTRAEGAAVLERFVKLLVE